MINLKDIQVGDIFSESSHYIYKGKTGSNLNFSHLESGHEVQLTPSYVQNLLATANSYDREVIVTKEDKQDGTLGIRSIWENIHSSQVFTVCYQKQNKAKSRKSIAEEQATQRKAAVQLIEKAKSGKKSMADAYEKALEFIQSNPVKEFIEGEDRVLKGYKVQFESRDGKYNCIDMDINENRPVNINTIKWLVYNGVKYIVK